MNPAHQFHFQCVLAGEIKDILQRASVWQNEIINDFGGIARHLDEIIEEDSQLKSIHSKLQIVNTEMSKLKDRMQLRCACD